MFGMSKTRETPSMRDAKSYQAWAEAAQVFDERSGAAQWKQTEACRHYDYRTIRTRLDNLQEVMRAGDPQALLFVLNEGIHGNMGGMGKSALYQRASFGTKALIEQYIDTLDAALNRLADVNQSIISHDTQLDFFQRASDCYGRTALMLSGAGSLTPFHIGVVQAMLDEDVLPNVISGASGGALVAGILASHRRRHLHKFFDPRFMQDISSDKQPRKRSAASMLWSAPLSTQDLERFVSRWIPDITFGEAFDLTGLHVNISVAPSEVQQKSRLLNATTSPHVYLREAVLASCAVPGVYPARTLAAKNYQGERQPYLPERQWIDGAVSDDLPQKRLARLYGVNHFVASQSNPLVLWLVQESRDDSLSSIAWEWGTQIFRESLKASRPLTQKVTRHVPGLNSFAHIYYSVMLQRYTSDINIIPSTRWVNPRRLLTPGSAEQIGGLIEHGRRAAWPKIERIRNSGRIGWTLDAILEGLEHTDTARRNAQGVAPAVAQSARKRSTG